MELNDSPEINLAHYRLEKALNLLEEASILAENKKWAGVLNRSYYAAFSAIKSILSLINKDSKQHSGVISLFDRYFVKTGIVDKTYSKILHAARRYRQKSDYDDFYEPQEQTAIDQLECAKRFVEKISSLLKEFIQDPGRIDALRKSIGVGDEK